MWLLVLKVELHYVQKIIAAPRDFLLNGDNFMPIRCHGQ
ncbi:Uncharacterised protein [Vibrio cholerae]|nr:Uncharacterised protein [Vibrio cholerae]